MTATNGPRSGKRVWLRRASLMTVLLAVPIATLTQIGAVPDGAPSSDGALSSGTAPSSPAPAGQLTGTGTVKTFSSWLDEAKVKATTKAQWVTIARHNTRVVLNSWDFGLIPILKHANPKIQVWVYKNLSGVRSDDCRTGRAGCGTCAKGVTDDTYLSSGMGYCWVKNNHPNWLIHAAGTGRPLQFRGYPDIWETDYGNRAYQHRWIQNVLADVKGHGWDGVEVDNALTTAEAFGVAAKYPTNAAVQAATYSALREVGPALRRAGVASVFNVGYATRFPGLWQRWLRPVQGLEQEFYLSYSTQPNAVGAAAWDAYQQEVSSCAVLHKSCWFHSGDYSAAVTPRTRRYALASYLLAANGQQVWAVGDTQPGRVAPPGTLGPPRGAMKRMGPAWGRYFARGIAIANPSRSWLTISLGGTYLDNGHPVSIVTLGPASGTVLPAAPRHGPPAVSPGTW
jgi:hypothetical protein